MIGVGLACAIINLVGVVMFACGFVVGNNCDKGRGRNEQRTEQTEEDFG